MCQRLHINETWCPKCNYIIELLCSTGICTLYEVHVTLSLQRLILQQKHKARGATILQKLHNSNVPLQFFFYLKFYTICLFHFRILFHCTFSLSTSFISVLSLCDFLLLSANLISRGYYDLVELAWCSHAGFVSNPLPTSVWAITRCPGSSSTQSHPRWYSQRRNFHPSAAISHIRFQFSTVYFILHVKKKWGKLGVWPFRLQPYIFGTFLNQVTIASPQ